MPNLIPEQEPACLSEPELTPAQQMALLSLHRDPLARAVLTALQRKTLRFGAVDLHALLARKLVRRTPRRKLELTYLGLCTAVPLTRALAERLEVKLSRAPRPSARNGLFGPGFSQAGNW